MNISTIYIIYIYNKTSIKRNILTIKKIHREVGRAKDLSSLQYNRTSTRPDEIATENCCSGRAISITYSECVSLALGIQNAIGMRHIITCGLPVCTIFFFTLSPTGHDLMGKQILNTKCVFSFPLKRVSKNYS